MINVGGWLLLSAIFGGLLLLVQRSERKRRTVSLVIVAIGGLLVWRYAMYRMSGDCNQLFEIVCKNGFMRQLATVIAVNTVNLSIVTALIFNLLFWILIGRSNPPGSSDSIQVFGMND
jgi:hypothetical protein